MIGPTADADAVRAHHVARVGPDVRPAGEADLVPARLRIPDPEYLRLHARREGGRGGDLVQHALGHGVVAQPATERIRDHEIHRAEGADEEDLGSLVGNEVGTHVVRLERQLDIGQERGHPLLLHLVVMHDRRVTSAPGIGSRVEDLLVSRR
jgi:hypothetical protein